MEIQFKNNTVDHDQCLHLAREMNIPYAFAVLLLQRGITTNKMATEFLNPRLDDLPSPLLMKDMEKAVSLVLTAFQRKWPVVIHGDYDVDGTSSTALLALFLKTLNINAVCFIPDRLSEGYGIHKESLSRLAPKDGTTALLVTVDCGITAVDEIKFAKKLGFRVIVTDHHEPPDQLPEAAAVLNPKQKDCHFPFTELAGVGVAFYLTMGIRNRLVSEGFWSRETAPNLKQFLDIVALGTVADVMSMTGVNRILVRAGLEVLTQRSRPGIWALAEQAGLSEGKITAEDISYRLAPRLNACGRLGKPDLALELLICSQSDMAMKLAGFLEQANQQRRQLDNDSRALALEQCKQQHLEGRKGFVVYGSYHPGIVGIIASRAAEKFDRPVIILTDDATADGQEVLKGSGRSTHGINLYEILKKCTETIIQFGGHAMAAGLTVRKSELAHFADMFNRMVKEHEQFDQTGQKLIVDYSSRDGDILEPRFTKLHQRLEPFGKDNPEPIFCMANQLVEQAGTIKNHLKYSLRCHGRSFHGIGFGLAETVKYARNQPVQLVFKIKNTEYRRRKRIELHTINIRPTL